MSLRADVSMLVFLLSLGIATDTAVSSAPPASYGLSNVTVEAGQDAVFRFNYDGEQGDIDEVRWFEHKTTRTVFSSKFASRTFDGFFVNMTLPGQFDLVVRKANASTAGNYTVDVKGQKNASFKAELRVVESVTCAALVVRNVTMVCSVVFADGRPDHHVRPDVTWSESATCSVSQVVEPEEPQRPDRTVVASTCVTRLDRLSELISRTCTVTFPDGGSSTGDRFSMECSVEVQLGQVRRRDDRPRLTVANHEPPRPEFYFVSDGYGVPHNAAGTRTVWTFGFWFGAIACIILFDIA